MIAVSNHLATVLTNIGWPSQDASDPIEWVGFTSYASGQGVSTIASQVAVTTATKFGTSTLLVDCDFSKPSLQQTFGLPLVPGLAEIVDTNGTTEVCVRPTKVPNLNLLTAGDCTKADDWDQDSLRNAFRSTMDEHNLVICDIPVLGTQSQAEKLLRMMDRVLVVVDSSVATFGQLHRNRDLMKRRGIALAGVVMNRSRSAR